MCILKGCSVAGSFVTTIGNQMALRKPVCMPSLLTLQAVTALLLEVRSVCNIHSKVHHALPI